MDESRLFIVGANGQLGKALAQRYPKAQTADITELDITDQASVAGYDWSAVDVIINAAAYTNVDGAETDEGRVAAWKVNATAVGHLVKAAIAHDLCLVHVSTEYVFDGKQETHTESEPVSPLGVYAQSKAAADITVGVLPHHYIVRTSWVMGEGKNFVKTMLGLGSKGINPSVISDDNGRPTFTNELVRVIDYLLSTKAEYGTYNASNDGDVVSWADLTRAAFSDAGLQNTVSDITDADYYADKPETAGRPQHSAFNLDKLHAIGFVSRDWRDDLKEYIEKEQAAS